VKKSLFMRCSISVAARGVGKPGLAIDMEAGYIDKTQGTQWLQETQQLSKMLFALIKYINTH